MRIGDWSSDVCSSDLTRPRAMGSPVAETSLTAAVLERFRAGLRDIWPEGVDESGARLGLAVSVGPDSLALLLLAHAALPGRVDAATGDHGLRAERDRKSFVSGQSVSERVDFVG